MAAMYQYNPSQTSPSSLQREKQSYRYEAVSEEEERVAKAQVVDQRMKRKIRRLRIVQRSINLVLSIIVLGIMLNTYLTFTSNRTFTPAGGSPIPIYPTQPITWPTFMMIGTSAVSMLFSLGVIIAYCCGTAASNRINNYAGYWGYLLHVINFGVWIATETTFRMMQGDANAVPPPNDLWGWTCSNAAAALETKYVGIVNFDLQCTTQQVSFGVGLVTAGFEIFGIIVDIIAMRRLLYKKKMAIIELRQRSGMAATQ